MALRSPRARRILAFSRAVTELLLRSGPTEVGATTGPANSRAGRSPSFPGGFVGKRLVVTAVLNVPLMGGDGSYALARLKVAGSAADHDPATPVAAPTDQLAPAKRVVGAGNAAGCPEATPRTAASPPPTPSSIRGAALASQNEVVDGAAVVAVREGTSRHAAPGFGASRPLVGNPRGDRRRVARSAAADVPGRLRRLGLGVLRVLAAVTTIAGTALVAFLSAEVAHDLCTRRSDPAGNRPAAGTSPPPPGAATTPAS